MRKTPSHCIVTPDFIGPIKNGGIGTACYELARYLSTECGAEITVLFTSIVAVGSSEEWTAHFRKEYGWRFLTLDDLKPLPAIPHHNCRWFLARSLQIHYWLRDQSFTHIHFQDWHANGFVAVQAKKVGVAYEETVLTCTVHSPQEWSEEGNLMSPQGGIESLLQRHCEKYASSNADVSIFPSRHMFDYVQAKGWDVGKPVVVPYLFPRRQAESAQKPSKVTELCFFGRLETRKGLEVFVAALERLSAKRGPSFLPDITFVGKHGTVKSGSSIQFLERFKKRIPIKVQILSNFDAYQAQAYIKADPGRVAVVPSLLDNLPYVVIECLQNKIPIVASRIGGIPELIGSEEHLFEPTEKGLSDCLEQIIDNGCPPAVNKYNVADAETFWTEMASSKPVVKQTSLSVNPSQITICVAYYNYGTYLPDLLDSLEKQTVSGFGVVVVNDGSTDEYSNKVFAEMASKYANKSNWKFVTQSNGGIGAARNNAASLADTDYIIFMDADNLAKPQMVERMGVAMEASNADCLACYLEGFEENSDSGDFDVIYRYIPTGNCPEAGCLENIFGDANCIIRRDAFEQIGKFSLDRDSSFEDWEFLAKMSLNGKRLDVIPEFLHLYRHTEQGFSRNTSPYKNQRRILNVYKKHLPAWGARMWECVHPLLASAGTGASTRSLSLANPWVSIYLPLPGFRATIRRLVRVARPSFDSRKYLSRYRYIISKDDALFDWCKVPRLHYVLFGESFPF